MDLALLSSRHPLSVRCRCARFIILGVVLVVGVLSLAAAPAYADLADQHYKRALRYYESKDYPRAIKELQIAYRARQLPKILLNIGQVYRKLGMASTALKFYEHYMRVEPNPKPEIKAEVDRYIAQTRAMLDPPEFVAPGSKMSAAEAAAAAVASAPSDVTPVTVQELYSDDDLPSLSQVGQREGGATARVRGRPPLDFERVQSPAQGAQRPPGAQLATQPGSAQRTARPVLPLIPTQPGPATPEKTPLYKQAWFWGVIGGVVAGAVLITGVAVGAQANALPPEILHPAK